MQLNGDATLVDPDPSYSGTDYADLYSVTTQLEGELITVDTVNVNGYIATTVGADIAENLAGLTVPEGAPYSIDYACWYNETLERAEWDGSFVAGCTYRLNIDVGVASGYVFADNLVMQFNGDESLVDPDYDNCYFGKTYAYLYSIATQLEGEVPTVDTVNVNGYVAPTVGADIAESLAGLTAPEGAPYSIDYAYWYNETLESAEGGGSFIAGCTYRLNVYIYVDSGYIFADELVMQLNGDATLVDPDPSYSGTDYADLYSVTTQLEGELITVDTVNVNGYVAPTVGADIAESLAGLTAPEGAPYSIDYAYWYNETLERDEWDGAFIAGCAYSLYVEIDVASGYVFADDIVMQFNGDESLVDLDYDNCYFGKAYAYLYSIATQLEGEVPFVDTVNINGYVAPTVGADIDESLEGLTVPEGAHYSISSACWYNETLEREWDGAFIAGCTYRLNVYIYVDSGYIFADELVMQFNGDASLVDTDRSYSGTNYAYLYSVTTQLEGELITVDAVNVNGYVAPTVGADIAENLAGLTVPEGAPYSIDDAYWRNETLGRDERNGTFVAGCAYHLYVRIYVDSGYVFADDLVMQFNGDASLADPDRSYFGKESAYLYSVATQLEGELITVDTVNVNGYVAPTAGADIAGNLAGLTVPEGAPYSIDDAYWRNETLDRYERNGTFIAGCTYRLRVRIDVASGYIFSDELVMQFNGDASLVDLDYDNCYFGKTYAYLYSVATELSVPAEFFTFASGADTTYISIDETNGCFVFKAGAKTADEVIALFADANISIAKAAGTAVTGTAKVGTTCIITSTINGESKSLTVVVVGDVNGDGSINSMDYSKINQVAKNKSTITDAAVLYAANTSPTSSKINSLDISRLTSFMKKKITNF